MKKLIFTGLFGLAAATAGWGQTFVNNIQLLAPPEIPPVINATTFINNSVFAVDLMSIGAGSTAPYTTSDTLNYTNFGTLGSSTGFRFETYNRGSGLYSRAQSLHNEVGATINCGGTNLSGVFSTNFVFSLFSAGSQTRASANDIVNRGTIETGPNALLSLKGNNINLAGGLINMEGFESGGFFDAGVFDYYWGIGDNRDWFPSGNLGTVSAFSPNHWTTNRYYVSGQRALGLSYAPAYQNVVNLGPSNVLIQLAYVQNLNPTISNNVYFIGGSTYIEWRWPLTNIVTGKVVEDSMTFADYMLSITNLTLITNGLAPYSTGLRSTYMPTNFSGFVRGGLFFSGFPPATPGLTPGLLPTGRVTNNYAAYQAIFRPTSFMVEEVAHQTYSNMAGRIEIQADNNLRLDTSRIAAQNYLQLSSPKNFTINPRTRILTYAADYDLGTTNDSITVTNLMPPSCPRLNGTVGVYSAIWTNLDRTTLYTNVYTVLLVDSQLASYAPTVLQNLSLHAPNVVITDVMNVMSNLNMDAYTLTIATNGAGAQNAAGQLNLLSANILWTNSFPRLQALTNWGVLSAQNAAFFGGMRYPPFYPTASVEPYQHFVNHGSVSAPGIFIWANNFENSGVIDAGPNPLNIQCLTATLTNGALLAANADITLCASSVLVSNQNLVAGRKLSIWATNRLDDGGITSTNFWTAGAGGFHLASRPSSYASLLGTTITNTAPDFGMVACDWAGYDRGATPQGYSGNAALGRLVLDGGMESQFILNGPTTSNALYVDYLELRNYSTNRDSSGNLACMDFGPNTKLYYAQAVIVNPNGTTTSVAERLNHKNNGCLNWVTAYAGAFSSTNMVYPPGVTNTLNLALVLSTSIDSDGDGTVNYSDPSPVFVPSQLLVTAAPSIAPRGTQLSWPSIANSTNYVYYKNSFASSQWQVLTNFVFGPYNGKASVLDTNAGSLRYYRVRVDARQP